jgi:capsular exopolysaccharide synthesis family protein
MAKATLNLYKSSNRVINDAYDRFIAKVPVLKEKTGCNVLTVSGAEPKAGATAMSINLAVALANANWTTLLVDGDFRKGGALKRLSEHASHGLTDYLSGNSRIEDAICTTNIENLYYTPSGPKPENPMNLLNSPGLEEFMGRAGVTFDFVIIDTPSLTATVDAGVIASKTDGVILIGRYMHTRASQIKNACREIEQSGAELIGVVFNRVSKSDYRRYAESFDYFVD